jgi:HSP20 family protein
MASIGRRTKMGEQVAVKKADSFWDQIQAMEDRIMRRAEGIFSATGSRLGKDLDNWLAAERELVWKPAIELKEEGDHFELRVAVAGVDPKDLKVEVTNDDILIKGETKKEEKKEEKKGESTICISEFQAGSLFRSVHFPKKIDPDKVKAELKNGLLTVTAVIAEAASPKKVAVKTA